MATKNQNDELAIELINLKIDAQYEIDWFRKYNPTHSTEEILMDMAKYLVQVKRQENRQEGFLLFIFGAAFWGSILMAFISILSRDWERLIWAIIVLTVSFGINIFAFGVNKNFKNKK